MDRIRDLETIMEVGVYVYESGQPWQAVLAVNTLGS